MLLGLYALGRLSKMRYDFENSTHRLYYVIFVRLPLTVAGGKGLNLVEPSNEPRAQSERRTVRGGSKVFQSSLLAYGPPITIAVIA